MSIKSIISTTIAGRWASLIENPEGFPNNPSKHTCWLWTGYMAPGSGFGLAQPRAKLLGCSVNPRRILYELHTGRDPHIRSGCGHRNCINPTHMVELGSVEEISDTSSAPAPAPGGSGIDWPRTFKGMTQIDFDNITAEELAAQTGAPLEAAQRYLDER